MDLIKDEKSFSSSNTGYAVHNREEHIKDCGGWEKYCERYGVIKVDKNTKGAFEHMGKWYIKTVSINDDGITNEIETNRSYKNIKDDSKYIGKWV